MQFSRLGDTGLIVSRLAFGVMTFGKVSGTMAAVAKTGQDEAEEVAEFDQAMAPTPIYPNWFHERTLDVTANEALRKGLPTQSEEVKV